MHGSVEQSIIESWAYLVPTFLHHPDLYIYIGESNSVLPQRVEMRQEGNGPLDLRAIGP